MRIETYPDRELLAMHVADQLAGELKNCLLANDFASFAIPGGTTPAPMFDFLSGLKLEWSRVRVMLTDERWVDETSPRSNSAMVRQRLLTGPAAKAQFVPFYAPGEPVEVVARLSKKLAPSLPISVLVLGMGDDMHTASLFPGAPGLAEALAPDAPALNILHPADQPEPRVSLAAHVLNGALSKHLIISGKTKRDALERASHMTAQQAPIRAVWDDITVHWAE